MHKFLGDAVDLRRATLIKQITGLVAPVVEYTIEHETQGVGGHERHLAGDAEQPAQVIDHFWVGLLPVDNFDDRIAKSRREKVGDRRSPGDVQMREQSGSRQGTRIRSDQCIRTHNRLDVAEYLALELEVLGRRFQHPVTTGHRGVIETGDEVLPYAFSLLRGQFTAVQAFLDVCLYALHCALQCSLVDIDQHQLEARYGALQVIGQIRADGSGTNDADAAGQRALRLVQ